MFSDRLLSPSNIKWITTVTMSDTLPHPAVSNLTRILKNKE